MPELFYPIPLGKKFAPPGVELSGWREPEDSHRWSVGTGAKLTLHCLAVQDGPRYLILRLAAFVSPGKLPGQLVTLSVNGAQAAVWRFNSPKFVCKALRLPDNIGDELAIAFATPDAASPAALGLSPDPDRLGVCLAFLALVNNRFLVRLGREGLQASFANQPEFAAWRQGQELASIARQAYDCLATAKWEFPGFCAVCGRDSVFAPRQDSPPAETGNLREEMLCRSCGLNNRQRLLFAAMRETVAANSDRRRIYLYEQASPFFSEATARLKGCQVTGSEYLGPGLASGELANGIRHEDALSLSFADHSFDLLIAGDVFEHVPKIEPALKEAFRVLAPGGRLLFTVPFDVQAPTSRQRAVLTSGGPNLLMPAIYHGNPIDANGSLVYYDFGWDLLNMLRQAGFARVRCLCRWEAATGHLGTDNLFFQADK
ncbi:MAG: methyltransferase domain-containing protein [Desulfobacteraceae bacterium]|nr:methyltransferase domain-containing protein [Desulfobacteraceae bacterium]